MTGGGLVGQAVMRALAGRPGSLTASGAPVDPVAAERAAGAVLDVFAVCDALGRYSKFRDRDGLARLARWAVRREVGQ